MSIPGLDHSIQQKMIRFSRDLSEDTVYEEINEDFSNALDVLRCLLPEKNHNIVNELLSISYRKSKFIHSTYRRGLEEGVNLKHNYCTQKAPM
jgi:hypothetical protein